MGFEQTEKTKLFIQAVNKLVETGEVKNRAAIIEALDWDTSLMSNVMNGRKNVPNDVYRKFSEVFPVTAPVPTDADYRDKYIALLEQQLRDQNGLIAELKERMDARTLQITDAIDKVYASLAALTLDQKATLAYAKTLYAAMIEHRSILEHQEAAKPENLQPLKKRMDKLLDEHFQHT